VTIRLLADENFKTAIVAGLRRVAEGVDLVRVQDVGLRKADDPTILAWAATEGRILLTHDIRTIPDHANSRIMGPANARCLHRAARHPYRDSRR
jgi:predicted nuclease of predicted toxin-antitoxin system